MAKTKDDEGKCYLSGAITRDDGTPYPGVHVWGYDKAVDRVYIMDPENLNQYLASDDEVYFSTSDIIPDNAPDPMHSRTVYKFSIYARNVFELPSDTMIYSPIGSQAAIGFYAANNQHLVQAAPFAITHTFNLVRIIFPIVFSQGPDPTMTVSVHEDSGSLPGRVIQSWPQQLDDIGITKTVPQGLASLVAGKYWTCVGMKDPASTGLWQMTGPSGPAAISTNGGSFVPYAIGYDQFRMRIAGTQLSA